MTPVSEIIQDAYREGNLIGLGHDVTDAEASEALRRLNAFVASLFGDVLGVAYVDWPVPPIRTAPVPARFPQRPMDTALRSDQWPYPPANVRLLVGIEQDTRVFLPWQPRDGARLAVAAVRPDTDEEAPALLTLDGNGRLVEGAASATGAPSALAGVEWLYRADLGSWTRLAPLTACGVSPLPEAFDELLVTGLSIRLSGRYGKEIDGTTMETYKRGLRLARARYWQVAEPVGSDASSALLNGMQGRGARW